MAHLARIVGFARAGFGLGGDPEALKGYFGGHTRGETIDLGLAAIYWGLLLGAVSEGALALRRV